MQDVKWQEAVKNAKHYLAVGQSDIYLYSDTANGDLPWDYCIKAESGCGHRFDIATSITFHAKHPCGLSFRWSFDIETPNANGASGYRIDSAAVSKMIARLSPAVAKQLQGYFKTAADAVEKQGEEYQKAANRQFGDAATLRSFCK